MLLSRNKKGPGSGIPDPLCSVYELQLALIQCLDLLHAGIAGVAGAAGICKSRLSQEVDVLFLQDALQVCA